MYRVVSVEPDTEEPEEPEELTVITLDVLDGMVSSTVISFARLGLCLQLPPHFRSQGRFLTGRCVSCSSGGGLRRVRSRTRRRRKPSWDSICCRRILETARWLSACERSGPDRGGGWVRGGGGGGHCGGGSLKMNDHCINDHCKRSLTHNSTRSPGHAHQTTRVLTIVDILYDSGSGSGSPGSSAPSSSSELELSSSSSSPAAFICS